MVALVLVRERGRDIRCVLFLPAAGAACCWLTAFVVSWSGAGGPCFILNPQDSGTQETFLEHPFDFNPSISLARMRSCGHPSCKE